MTSLHRSRRSFLQTTCLACFGKIKRGITRIQPSSTSFSTLPPPSIVFSNHHLLAVNKPAGWQSVPNTFQGERLGTAKKCLLSHLKSQQLGGGSDGRFLLPLHRIDQPCTGTLLFAKNSKAASRITKQWKDGKVQKTYLCLVDPQHVSKLEHYSTNLSSSSSSTNAWHELKGWLLKKRKALSSTRSSSGWSVSMIPNHDVHVHATAPPVAGARLCHIQYQWLERANKFALLRVRTNVGARHMVRSLLGQVGHAPILGDLRYGGTQGLEDQSVALHARSVSLSSTLQLGGLEEDDRFFVAPLPPLWKEWYGLTDNVITQLEQEGDKL